MMYFFGTVKTYLSTGKSAKGRELQAMARRLEGVLVQGEDAIVKIVSAMREQACELDHRYNRGNPTFVDYSECGNSGMITAVPVSESGDWEQTAYFNIYFHTVVRTATVPEAIDLINGLKT